MSTTQPRRPAGVPTGGQFASKSQPAPGFALDADDSPGQATIDGRPVEPVVEVQGDGGRTESYRRDGDPYGPDDDAKVSFSPEAIRQHFEEMGASTADLSDEQLRSVAEDALGDYRLWDTYHRVLDSAIRREREGRTGDHVWARALPNYTEVSAEFSSIPGRRFRLMARGMPAGPGDSGQRRFTNLDTGMELFVPADGTGVDGDPLFSHIEIAEPR